MHYIKAVGAPIMVPPAYNLGLTLKDYEEIGVKIISGLETILAASKAIEGVLKELHATGTVKEEDYHSKAISGLGDRLGWQKWFDLEKRFQLSKE